MTAVRGEAACPKCTSIGARGSNPSPSTVAKGPPAALPSGGCTSETTSGWGGSEDATDSAPVQVQPLGHNAAMRTRIAALVIAVAACGGGERASDFDGDYELVEQLSGSCEGPLEPAPIEPTDRYFRFAAEPFGGGKLVAYYSCASPGECNDTFDLFRSFGRSDGRWATTVATAVSPGCLLRFRRRELVMTMQGVLITETVHETLDETLPEAECVQATARDRGETMPCVSASELVAERR